MDSRTALTVTPDSLVVYSDTRLVLATLESTAMTLVVTCELATCELATWVLATCELATCELATCELAETVSTIGQHGRATSSPSVEPPSVVP